MFALAAAGFRVVESNFRVTGAEIDVVCRDGDGLAFVEVRARGEGPLEPSATIDGRKFRHLLRGARAWLTRHGQQDADWRFVVVSVTLDSTGRPVATEILEDPFLHLPEFHRGDP
ncbi:MAG: YraN family protein [Planctomycetes bacterium]|nr:YraN family protein [Planctomycetota bacterium]